MSGTGAPARGRIIPCPKPLRPCYSLTCRPARTYDLPSWQRCRGTFLQGRMTVFRRLLLTAVFGAALTAGLTAQDKDKKDRADTQLPTADLTPVWVVMDAAMAGTGGVQAGYG